MPAKSHSNVYVKNLPDEIDGDILYSLFEVKLPLHICLSCKAAFCALLLPLMPENKRLIVPHGLIILVLYTESWLNQECMRDG
jgi:hypothetical protein